MESSFDQTCFGKLFRLLEPDGQTIEARFWRCRLKLVKFFAWRHCDDPDNLADETIARLLKNVHAGQELSDDNPYSYVYAIATNVFQEYLRAKKKGRVLLDLDAVPEIAISVVVDDCKRHCLEQLSDAERELLAHYYLEDDDRNNIALEHSQSLNALRLRVHRIKHRLRCCWEDCVKRSKYRRN
jgi:DNA-directed RNA polymerase specialized sigma24 family protein